MSRHRALRYVVWPGGLSLACSVGVANFAQR